MALKLRKCVVGVLERGDGTYLVGERAGLDGCLQFPQGGVEDGETPDTALVRELAQEIGCGDVEILRKSQKTVDYAFPAGLKSRITQKFSGQSQDWYLVRLKNGAQPDLKLSDGEFQNISWKTLTEIMAVVVDWKYAAYIDGLSQLGIWPQKGGE